MTLQGPNTRAHTCQYGEALIGSTLTELAGEDAVGLLRDNQAMIRGQTGTKPIDAPPGTDTWCVHHMPGRSSIQHSVPLRSAWIKACAANILKQSRFEDLIGLRLSAEIVFHNQTVRSSHMCIFALLSCFAGDLHNTPKLQIDLCPLVNEPCHFSSWLPTPLNLSASPLSRSCPHPFVLILLPAPLSSIPSLVMASWRMPMCHSSALRFLYRAVGRNSSL